ncbi:hypothetical protein FC839_03105 [Clostridium botulinum]|uniref:Uncharacterized protein n=2 Tax=Clostridium botulinum TaxID=1491 RepID=A0A6B4JIS6_CLOBO|nr:hypothetical protein [Clostridium botulinum]MBY6760675.1 hypothetical protein [Clostridium botulinum]MBY6919582.1 hypothetical protein [Clostridium botulinum]NFG58149.1 hypothetical protein [Clostridium botulinum]NFJ56787.1 hypothetical protein [Clostridium botulinum]NFL53850.1 hypothetical protein [Clostridium botulinum]
MSDKLICPLKFQSEDNECIPNCAWNAGSKVKPLCAMMKISFNLTSIDENNGGLIFNHSDDD